MERAPARRAARAGHPSGPDPSGARRLVFQTPPRSAISASVPLGGERSFAPFAFSRKRSSANKAFEVDSASPRPKRKTQRGRTNRKKTSGTSHGLVQQRIASTLRTRAPSIMAIRAPSRVLRSKLCLEARLLHPAAKYPHNCSSSTWSSPSKQILGSTGSKTKRVSISNSEKSSGVRLSSHRTAAINCSSKCPSADS